MWKLLAAAVNRFVMRAFDEASTEPSAKGAASASARQSAGGPELLTREGVEQQFQRAIGLLQSGNAAAAEEAIQLAVKRAANESGKTGPIYALALFKEGTILRALGARDRAAEAWRAAVAVPPNDEAARKERLTYRASLAALLADLGALDEAEEVLRACAGEQKERLGADDPGYALALSALADLLLVKGEPGAALEALDEAVRILTTLSHERLPIDLATRAFAIKSAQGIDREGLDRWRALPSPMQMVLVKQCVARAEHYDAKVARAVLLELCEKLQATPDAAPVLPLSVNIGLANLARASGDHDARIEALQRTIGICERFPDRTHLVLAHQELAAALDEAGHQADVPAAYDAALLVAREANQPALLSAVLRNYAIWSDRAGNRERAEELHRDAVHHGASCGDWAVHGRSTTAYGIFLQHGGRTEEARRMLEEALAHLPPAHADTAAAHEHLNALDRGESCSCNRNGVL